MNYVLFTEIKCTETQGVIKMIRFWIMWPFLGIAQEYSSLDKSQEVEYTAKLHE